MKAKNNKKKKTNLKKSKTLCRAGQCRQNTDEPQYARYDDVQEREDQVERSPTLMRHPPPYKRRGTSLPGGGA